MGDKRHYSIDPAGWILLVAGAAAIAFLLAIDIASSGHQPGWSINGETLWGRDFANLWSAGRLWLEGKTAILYQVEPYQAWQRVALGPGIDNHNYSYPPLSLLYAPLFGALPYLAALLLWLGLSALAFFVAARGWLARVGAAPWWGLALPSTLLCLWAGHYGLIVGALWCAAWTMLERKPIHAGVATGLMLVKPHLAILMPLLLARRRAWRAMAAAAATVALLVGGSALLFGPELWSTYLASTSGLQLALVQEPGTMFGLMMPTVATSLFAYGAPAEVAFGVQALVALATVGLLLWRLPADPVRAGALGAVATFLVLPYGFNYDMTVVGLAAFMLLVESSRDGRRGEALVAGLALALPPGMIVLGAMNFRIAPIVVALLFAALWRRWALAGGRRLAVEVGA